MPPIQLIVVTNRDETAGQICAALACAPDIRISVWATSMEAVLAANVTHDPDLLLLDTDTISHPIDFIRALRRHMPTVKIIACAAAPTHVQAALHAGANGYLLANSTPDELLSGLRSAYAGKIVIAQDWLREMFGNHNNS